MVLVDLHATTAYLAQTWALQEPARVHPIPISLHLTQPILLSSVSNAFLNLGESSARPGLGLDLVYLRPFTIDKAQDQQGRPG